MGLSIQDVLCHKLDDVKATFVCLSMLPLLELQQPLVVCWRVDATRQPPAKMNVQSPLDGQKLYSLYQAMDVIRSSSASVQAVTSEMVKRGRVPLKKVKFYPIANKFLGEGKAEAPLPFGA